MRVFCIIRSLTMCSGRLNFCVETWFVCFSLMDVTDLRDT